MQTRKDVKKPICILTNQEIQLLMKPAPLDQQYPHHDHLLRGPTCSPETENQDFYFADHVKIKSRTSIFKHIIERRL